jgi:signal transduction histidine kinase
LNPNYSIRFGGWVMSFGNKKNGNSPSGKIKKRMGRVDVRIALIFLLFFTIASSLLFGFSLFFLFNSFRDSETEAAGRRLLHYWALFQSGGMESLMDEIEEESMIFEERPFFTRIADSDNRTLFLRYPRSWESFAIDQLDEYPIQRFEKSLSLESEGVEKSLEVFTIELSEDLMLQVGMSNARSLILLRLYRRNFLLLLGGLLLFGFSFALLLSGRLISPLRRLNQGIEEIIATNDFSRRVQTRRVDDELDDLIRLFNTMVERIEHLLFRMKENVDTLAHDLRTPMTLFRSSAEEALSDPGTGDAAAKALSTALEQSDRIISMMNTIMDITEAETGTLRLYTRKIELFSLAASLAELYRMLSQEKNITIHVEGEEVYLEGDKGRIEQALANLLDNGVKFSPRGSEIIVKVYLLEKLHRKNGQGEKRAVIEVRDRGPGIAQEELPHIFERLYRGAASKKSPGTGLGLGLVKAIAQSHGGNVEVESAVGKGSSFRIILPIGDCGTA